jgi:hypothetical protein
MLEDAVGVDSTVIGIRNAFKLQKHFDSCDVCMKGKYVGDFKRVYQRCDYYVNVLSKEIGCD